MYVCMCVSHVCMCVSHVCMCVSHVCMCVSHVCMCVSHVCMCVSHENVVTFVHKIHIGIFILQTDPSGEIIVFPNGGCPWRDHLSDIEQEQNLSPNIKYVIYSDNNGHWRVQCVPARIGSFENR
jgi:uncharacterized UPF0160 family protein